MGSNYSSSDSSDEDINDDDNTSDTDGDQDKDIATPSLDLGNLFDNATLRILASKVKDDIPENVVQQHNSTLVRWLEERQQQNEETVTQSQFYDVLMNRSVGREDCIEAFQQFDSEGDGTADVTTMLEALKASSGSRIQEEMAHVVRTLQSCSLTPGIIDVYNEEKESIGQHGARLLNFLLRNRAPSVALPFPILNGFNNTVQMRQAALESFFSKLKDTAFRQQEETILHDGEEFRPIEKCFHSVDVSTNKSDSYRLFNRDFSSYWQSDGSARSHWIRFRMKSNVVVKQLCVGVSASDQSYMPNLITVSVGKSAFNLREIKEIKVSSHITGDVTLLEDLKTYYPIIQVNIKRCQSDGCDTRIHHVKIIGYRVVKESGVSVSDSAAAWYLQVMASTAMASITMAPELRHVILGHTKGALKNMPPLSLSPSSSERPAFLSPHVLKQLDKFLHDISQDPDREISIDGLQVLLNFDLARGYISGILTSVIKLQDQKGSLELGPLLHSIDKVRDMFWNKTGGRLQLTLAGSNGGQKDEASCISNVLATNWSTSQVYLSGEGKTKVDMYFNGTDHIQITKIRIKVDKGARGARRGLVFVYKDPEKFNLETHEKRFSHFDSWKVTEYNLCNAARNAGILKVDDNPVAYFSLEDDWDEVEVPLDVCPVGKFILIKFLETRQPTAERLGIAGIKFYGFHRRSVFLSSYEVMNMVPYKGDANPDGKTALTRILAFLISLTRDQNTPVVKPISSRLHHVDLSNISIELIWNLYNGFSDKLCQVLSLQILHALFPFLASIKDQNREISEKFFEHLCSLVDDLDTEKMNGDRPADELDSRLHLVARQVIIDGAAVFFPDKEARRKQLFSMMTSNTKNGTQEAKSVTLTFQSLCLFFSSVDPSGLLDLPGSITEDFDPDPVLQVLETLISVAYQEFRKVLDTVELTEQSSHLVQLLCSLQTSLLGWVQRQIISNSKEHSLQVQTVLVRYVTLLSSRVIEALSQYAKAEPDKMMSMMKKMEASFLATVLRQMVSILTMLTDHVTSLTRTQILQHLLTIARELRALSPILPEVFYSINCDAWKAMDKGEVILRNWEVESPHNYENNMHTKQIFSCPGASMFIVEFDPKCETERRYDYLEFTDSRGLSTRYDQKVGTEKWPVKVTYHGGHRLQFLFHSDGSNNEWGYKFKITAKGSPDVALGWMFDLQLSIGKLCGKLCGATLDVTQVLPKSRGVDPEEEAELDLLKSELWTTLFKGGYMVGKLQRSLSGRHTAEESVEVIGFLLSLSDTSSECKDPLAEPFYNRCMELAKTLSPPIGGAEVDLAVRAVFAALIWHTQQLREDLEKYVKNEGLGRISDSTVQAFKTADNLRTFLVEKRQKQKMAAEKNGQKTLYDPIGACKEKALFLLKFAGLSKVHLRSETKAKYDRRMSKMHNRLQLGAGDNKIFKFDMDRHPSFRLVIDFVRDPAWSKDRVEQLLKQRAQQAQAVAEVYMTAAEFLRIMADEHTFQIPNVVFLQEMFSYQDKFAKHYADGLDGCGLDLESKVRRSFYMLVRRMVDSIRAVNRLELSRSLVSCYDFMQACTLHLLDVNWQVYDLFLLVDLKLPELYLKLAKGSVSMREKVCVEVDSAKELEDHTKSMKWMKEVRKGSFMEWYHKYHKKDDKELKKAIQMFIARACDLLDVEISCDGCNDTLPGRRYRCLQCEDMDLCSTCYAGGVKPDQEHTDDHEMVHLQYKCDECFAFIVGTRIHCNECDNFDLCYGCNSKGTYPAGHNSEHKVTTFNLVKWKTNTEAASSVLSYIHQHVWLLYSSVALSMANLLYNSLPTSRDAQPALRGPPTLDPDYIKASTQLYNMGIDLAVKSLMLIASNDDADSDDDDDTPSTMQARQEEAFAIHSQERIMGLLGAMLPAETKTPLADDVSMIFSTKDFLSLMFFIAIGDSGHEMNTQHFAIGLIGQLLQRTSTDCKIVDMSVRLAKARQKQQSAVVKVSSTAVEATEVTNVDITNKKFSEESGESPENEPKISGSTCEENQDVVLGSTVKPKDTENSQPVVCEATSSSEAAAKIVSVNDINLKALPLQDAVVTSATCAGQRNNVTVEPASVPGVTQEVTSPKITSTTGPIAQVQPTIETSAIAQAEIPADKSMQCLVSPTDFPVIRVTTPEPTQSLDSSDSCTDDTCDVFDGAFEDDGEHGIATARFLFSFGAKCLKRSGLVWANSMAGVLQKLFNAPMWREVLLRHLSMLVEDLKQKPDLSSIFALFVVAGFPEVLSIGSPVKYMDVGTDIKEGVVLKYFPDKNQALLVDRKSRKRRTVKDEFVECISQDTQVLTDQHLSSFVDVITTITSRIRNGEQVGFTNSWVLALTLKALLMTLTSSSGSGEAKQDRLFQPDFVRCVVYLATQGTGFSKQWLLRDLEILSLMLYTRDREEEDNKKDEELNGKKLGKTAQVSGGSTSKEPEPSGGSTSKEPEPSGGSTSKEPEPSGGSTSKEPEPSGGSTSKEPEPSGGSTSKEPEPSGGSTSKEPEPSGDKHADNSKASATEKPTEAEPASDSTEKSVSVTPADTDKVTSSKAEAGSSSKVEEPSDDSASAKQETPASSTSSSPEKDKKAEGGDPWKGLDDTTKLCFQTLNEHLNVNISVLRTIYDLHGQNTDALLMEVHDTFEAINIDPNNPIRLLAKKWEKESAPRDTETHADKAVDVGVQLTSLAQEEKVPYKERTIEEAEEEPSQVSSCPVPMADNDVQSNTQKQRRAKSANLLKKELENKSKTSSKDVLVKVNSAITVLYARQVLTMLLADWPSEGPTITAQLIGCKDSTQMPFVLDLLHRPESREIFQKVVHNVTKHCEPDGLMAIAMTSCQFMEEVNLTTVTKESEHNYSNNCNIEDKIHIPGATFLAVKFDNRCCSEESCDELVISSSANYKQDKHTFSGAREKWIDFDMPGDTIYCSFTSDGSNNEWGYRFTVTGGKMGRFDTGYMILIGVLSVTSVIRSLPLDRLWSSLVYVACKQTGLQRLKAIQLMLKLIQSQFRSEYTDSLVLDLSLLQPLWKLYSGMTGDAGDSTVGAEGGILSSVARALTELFLKTEELAIDWGIEAEYAASLLDKTDIQQVVYQGMLNIAAVSEVLELKNKITEGFRILREKLAAKKSSKSD